jgi:hypothetical protein
VAAPYSNLAVTTGVNDLVFEIHFNHPNQDPNPPDAPPFIAYLPVPLGNVDPDITNCPNTRILITDKTGPNDPIHEFLGVNGSDTPALNQLDLVWSLECPSHPTFFTIGNTINEEFPDESNWGKVFPTDIFTPEGVYEIIVTLTDGGGLFIDCVFEVEYTYALNITFDGGVNSACMTNSSDAACGNPPIVTSLGGFTIDNADPFTGAPFKLQGNTSGPANTDLEISYVLEISDNDNPSNTWTLNAGTQGVADVNTSETVNLPDGDYSYEITIRELSFNFPPSSTSVTQATATILNS